MLMLSGAVLLADPGASDLKGDAREVEERVYHCLVPEVT